MTGENPDEPVTVTDKRRIDPQTGEVRAGVPGPAPQWVGAGALPPKAPKRRTRRRSYSPTCSASRRTSRTTASARCATSNWQLSAQGRRRGPVAHGARRSGPGTRRPRFRTAEVGGGQADRRTARAGAELLRRRGRRLRPVRTRSGSTRGDGSNPVIGTVMRRGYRLGEQLLRHALVVSSMPRLLAQLGATRPEHR